MTHNKLKEKALKKKNVIENYNELELEFDILKKMLIARKRAGLTQKQIAELMGTKSSAITRLESALSSGIHSPSLKTLKKYAHAVHCNLEIKFVNS